jgi:methylated-DNA-[protein]-cysteine S-methyltransferase
MPKQLLESDVDVFSVQTALGHVAVAVGDGTLMGVSFGNRTAHAAQSAVRRRLTSRATARWLGNTAGRKMLANAADARELAAEILDRLALFADGEPVDFADIRVADDHLTPFGRRVVKACRSIRRGETQSYGELAKAAGAPGAARAVGHVMATNCTPLVVPCHRVVAAGGRLGGFSAPNGLTRKRRLLDLESIRPTGK